MKPFINTIVIAAMLFVVVSAILLLLSIFDFVQSKELADLITKLGLASGVIAVSLMLLLGLSKVSKN
jgi:hypothetical protein